MAQIRGSVLVIVEGVVGEQMSGPEIRGWEIARALGRRMPVTVAVDDPARVPSEPGLRVVSRRRLGLIREAAAHGAVLAPWLPAYVLAGAAGRGMLTVADLYDPVEIESASLGPASDREFLATARRARRMQLRFADALMCASESQRGAIEAELGTLPTADGRPPVIVVPFGIGPDPPVASRRRLREAFPVIAASDPVILWWGSIWRWMDADTAIRAAAQAAERRPGLRLVFTAGRPPGEHVASLSATGDARRLAETLRLRDRVVFFIEDWIPYRQRHEYLLDATVGLSLHRDPREAKLSARARSMDFLWTRLPCVLTEGTELGARFAASGFAEEVPIGDVEAACAALLKLVDDSAASRRAREAGSGLAGEYRWEAVAGPLQELLAGARPARRGMRAAAAAAATAYYAQRVRQEVVRR